MSGEEKGISTEAYTNQAAAGGETLSWEAGLDIYTALQEWKKARRHLDFLPLKSTHWEAALAYETTCRQEYLALLAEAKAQGHKATMAQCVWWTLEAKRKPARYYSLSPAP